MIFFQANIVPVYIIALINALTFILFGYDKFCATLGWSRVRERTLLLLVVLGGGIGALISMSVFRHKTRKGSFQIVLGLILLIQIALFLFLFYQTEVFHRVV